MTTSKPLFTIDGVDLWNVYHTNGMFRSFIFNSFIRPLGRLPTAVEVARYYDVLTASFHTNDFGIQSSADVVASDEFNTANDINVAELNGKRAIILGMSGVGVGMSLPLNLAKHGVTVYGCSRTRAPFDISVKASRLSNAASLFAGGSTLVDAKPTDHPLGADDTMTDPSEAWMEKWLKSDDKYVTGVENNPFYSGPFGITDDILSRIHHYELDVRNVTALTEWIVGLDPSTIDYVFTETSAFDGLGGMTPAFTKKALESITTVSDIGAGFPYPSNDRWKNMPVPTLDPMVPADETLRMQHTKDRLQSHCRFHGLYESWDQSVHIAYKNVVDIFIEEIGEELTKGIAFIIGSSSTGTGTSMVPMLGTAGDVNGLWAGYINDKQRGSRYVQFLSENGYTSGVVFYPGLRHDAFANFLGMKPNPRCLIRYPDNDSGKLYHARSTTEFHDGFANVLEAYVPALMSATSDYASMMTIKNALKASKGAWRKSILMEPPSAFNLINSDVSTVLPVEEQDLIGYALNPNQAKLFMYHKNVYSPENGIRAMKYDYEVPDATL